MSVRKRKWTDKNGRQHEAWMIHINTGLLKLDEVEAMVYEADVYERLVEGARTVGPEELAIVLVMGDAGLRQGELRGLYVSDVRFDPPVIRVQRALSIVGDEHPPKGRRNRTVPMREYMRVRRRTRVPQGSCERRMERR